MNSLDIQKWRNKYIYQINESEDDDFNITTDAFDEVELKTGDIITRDMWKDPDWDGQEMGPLEIGDIVAEDGDEFVILAHTEYDYWEEYDLNYVNSMLKHPYKIVLPLNESEEEDFNITTDSFDVAELKKGDIIYKNMWKNTKWRYFTKRGNVEIADVGRDDFDYVILADSEDKENWEEYDLNYVNSMLKHPYKIFFSLDEQYEDDDFNITTDAFDEVEIKPGDHITPKMWNLDNPDLDLYIDDPDEDWVINRFNRSGDVELRTETGGHIITSIESIEDLLKPKYKIVLN
jgi:hypothetical protein